MSTSSVAHEDMADGLPDSTAGQARQAGATCGRENSTMTRQYQRHTSDVICPVQSMAATFATKDGSTMTQADAAPFDGTSLEAARAREATIRAIGLDGVVLGGATIRRMRRAAGLSSDGLAVMIGYSGALVRAWETGRRRCPPHLYLTLIEIISHARKDNTLAGTRAPHERFVAGHHAA